MYLLFFSIFFFLFVSLFFRFVLFRISLYDTCFLKSSPRSKTDCIYDNEHFDIKKSSLLHVGVDRVFVVHRTYRLCLFSFFLAARWSNLPLGYVSYSIWHHCFITVSKTQWHFQPQQIFTKSPSEGLSGPSGVIQCLDHNSTDREPCLAKKSLNSHSLGPSYHYTCN